MNVNEFTEHYRLIYQDLYRFALYTMRNAHDAEDAVSEAVMAAFAGRANLRDNGAFKSWMFSITANVCRKRLRKRPPEPVEEVPDTMAPGADPAVSMALSLALGSLTDEDRLIVALSVFGGYTSAEIGAMTNMNAATVRSRRKRACEKLAKQLEGVTK